MKTIYFLDICRCGRCNEIVYGNRMFKHGHNGGNRGHLSLMKGKQLSKESRLKNSLAHIGKHHTIKTRQKMSAIRKGKKRPAFTDKWKQNISNGKKGKSLSNEHRKNIANAMQHIKPMLGKHLTDEHKLKLSIAHKGIPHSEEQKLKISITHKSKIFHHKQTEETKQKLSKLLSGKNNSRYGIPRTEETKQKISQANKNKHPSETARRKMSEWQRGDKSPRWNNGSSFLPYCHKFNKTLKEAVRTRDSRTCQLCGIKENSHKHHVHHIHYDKSNCYPDLISLCEKCNGKANFNRNFYESLFMNKLNDRTLLFWTKSIIK